MKNILFIITQSEYGGAQRFLYTLVTNLDPMEYQVVVALGNVGTQDFLEYELSKKKIKTHRLKYLTRNPNLIKDVKVIFEIRKLIQQTRAETVFLLSSKAGFIGSLASVFPTRLNVKVIYRIGGWAFNDPRPWWQKMLYRSFERISASWKDIIVVNSQKDAKDANIYRIKPKNNVIIIQNGLDPYRVNQLNKDHAREYILPFNKIDNIVIGTIANMYPTKGLIYLLQAFQNVLLHNPSSLNTPPAGGHSPLITLVIIGDGSGRKELENYIAKHNLQDNVILIGQLPDAGKYISAFDIFVLPSLKEGFPWVILEAMAARVPIIASNVGALPEMIKNGKNGFLVDPARPQQIARKIEQLISDDHLRQELGIQGHQTLLFKFGLDTMIEKVKKLL